jgi:hypothetical protein
VAEAARLRGEAAEVRDRGGSADPDGHTGRGLAYWPKVAQLLRQSYRELHRAINEPALVGDPAAGADPARHSRAE